MNGLITRTLFAACYGLFVLTPVTTFSRDIALNDAGNLLFTANADSQSISSINVTSLIKLGEFKLKFQPESLALDDQDRIWVTFRRDDAVGVFNSSNGATIALLDVGDEPFDVLPLSATHVVVSLY